MISDKTYHLTEDGHVVDELDPDGVTLLMCKGGTIPDAVAAKYHLPVEFKTPKEAEGQKAQTPSENKAMTPTGTAALGATTPEKDHQNKAKGK